MKLQYLHRIIYLSILFMSCNSILKQDNDNETDIIIEVEFFNYIENSIEFQLDDGTGTCFWVDTIDMRILSGEYKDKEIKLIMGEFPIRNEFKIMGRYYIKINEKRLEENFTENEHPVFRLMPIISGDIKFVDK